MTIDCIALRRSHKLLLSLILITSFILLPPRSSVDTVEVRNKLCRAPKARDLQRSGGVARDLQQSGGTIGTNDLQEKADNLNQRGEERNQDRKRAQQTYNLHRPTDLHQHDKTSNLHRREDLHHTDKARDLHRNTTTYDAQLGSCGRREVAGKPQEAVDQGWGEELHPVGTEAEKKKQTKEDLHQNGKTRDLHRSNRKSGAPLVTARYVHTSKELWKKRNCWGESRSQGPRE